MNQIYRLIKLNRAIKSHRAKLVLLLLADIFRMRHLFVRFDPAIACNLQCLMCPFSDPAFRKGSKPRFTDQDIKRIASLFFPLTYQLVIGCGAEPTIYKNYPSILELAKKYKVPFIGFTTNGQLLTKQSIQQIFNYSINEFTLSIHGVKKDTYERFMVNASFEKLLEVLKNSSELKQGARVATPAIRINYTVNPDNLEELETFFDVFGEYSIDILQIRPMVDLGNTQYVKHNLSQFFDKYQNIIDKLSDQCKKKNIVFLANKFDPDLTSDNPQSAIISFVLRYISPQCVWKDDFEWRYQTYSQFCRKIGWRKLLFSSIFKDAQELNQMKVHLGYDIYS